MQTVDGKLLDEVAHGNDELVGTLGGNYSRNNLVEVSSFVAFMCVVKQLFYDIGEFFWKCLADFRTCVFG
jgi:hypothetical protein